MEWFVYMISTDNNKLYTGITNDLERRWNEHSQTKKGAKFFRTCSPVKIVYIQKLDNKSDALKLEIKIKKMNKSTKLILIDSKENEVSQIDVALKFKT